MDDYKSACYCEGVYAWQIRLCVDMLITMMIKGVPMANEWHFFCSFEGFKRQFHFSIWKFKWIQLTTSLQSRFTMCTTYMDLNLINGRLALFSLYFFIFNSSVREWVIGERRFVLIDCLLRNYLCTKRFQCRLLTSCAMAVLFFFVFSIESLLF